MAEGRELESALVEGGIATGTTHGQDRQANPSTDTRTVIAGHPAKTYWFRFRRGNKESDPVLLCTCQCFGQHAACEHVYFIAAVRSEPPQSLITHPPALDCVPVERKRGRKRKECS